MKNGIYFFLILFLSTMGYFVVNDLFQESSMLLASLVFLFVSSIIVVLVSHFKKKQKLVEAQKFIGVIGLSLLALYGVSIGVYLVQESILVSSLPSFEGVLFIIGSSVLVYSVFTFLNRSKFSSNGFA